jgi:cyclopropane fatty-acyl-phospholipid synthase-like methyltransferase
MEGQYYKSKNTVEEYIQLAKDVNGLNLIKKFKQYLRPQSTLLEIGTGPGTDWKILNEDFNVIGSDYSEVFLSHLELQYPSGTFIQLDASTLNLDSFFDGVYSNKVLHHLKDHELGRSIKRQYEILNEKGVICHSFWKGEGSEVFKGLFVNYHTETELRKLFENYFDILHIEQYAEFEQGDSILLIGQRK